MNELIEKLAEQAEINRFAYNQATMMNERVQEFDKEKFAELIVCECADLYNHEDVLAPIGMSARGEAHQHGWIEGTKTYRDTILEHFGVKE